MAAQYDRNKWAIAVLNQLLDKYEASATFVRGERTARRVQVQMKDATVPLYRSGGMDPDERKDLHATLSRWADEGLVELEWDKFERGNMLSRVMLCWDGIDGAYRVLGRAPKTDELSRIQSQLDSYAARFTWPWMSAWLSDVTAYMAEQKTVPDRLIPVDGDKRRLLLDALAGLVHKGEEVLPMRIFSKRYLKASKAFEQQVRPRFVRLVRQYGQASDSLDAMEEAWTDDSVLLSELGIEVTHEDVAFCGPIAFSSNGQTMDCTPFVTGVALDAETLSSVDIVSMPVRRILSIENKANYRQYVRTERAPDELVIYLGGFPSPGKRRFLGKLWDYASGCGSSGHLSDGAPVFHHWGDLDYGGILIGQVLIDTVWPAMTPWRMEPEWLDKHADFLETFDAGYRSKLELLLGNPRYELWYPLIRKVLHLGGTLEQEALIV